MLLTAEPTPAREAEALLERLRICAFTALEAARSGDVERLLGRPARIAALARFIDYVKSHDKVWFARRVDIARHWHATHPFKQESVK